MEESIIQVENLGKKYLIQHQEGDPRYRALRDVLADGMKSAAGLLRGRRPTKRTTCEEFWALQDINFKVQQGEVVGVIGRNGAGKSTLLKILSRITEPTTGRVILNGRVASLLEVGTGFHPELTGRENIYLNGSILGMKRKEIDCKFDEIVAFAGVEKFLDTPVKRYSSGMYVRLAFAVAAHLEPEILVVDEVLAVGDAEFQKKCIGKMKHVASGGRTILFVSHNMAAVQALCDRAILMCPGQPVREGGVPEMIAAYSAEKHLAKSAGTFPVRLLGDGIYLHRFVSTPANLVANETVRLTFELTSEQPVRLLHLCLIIYSGLDLRVGVIDFRPHQPPFEIVFQHMLRLTCRLDRLNLVEGDYSIGLYLVTPQTALDISDLHHLTIAPALRDNGFTPYPAQYRGVVEFDYAIDEMLADPPELPLELMGMDRFEIERGRLINAGED